MPIERSKRPPFPDPAEVARSAFSEAMSGGFRCEKSDRTRIRAEDVAGMEAVVHAALWLAGHRDARVKVDTQLEELGSNSPGVRQYRVRFDVEGLHGEEFSMLDEPEG